jgi:hypothetical protein
MTPPPLTLCWSPPPEPGRTLFVLFAYHGRDADHVRAFWERFESPALRGHRIVHRDHYANPRRVEYQLALIAEAAAHLSPGQRPTLVVDSRFETPPDASATAPYERVDADVTAPAAWHHGVLAEAPAYDHVVLVYPDALGLGCDQAERAAMRGRASVFVINGRRRAFRLTPAVRRRLHIRRVLAHTRLVERGFALAVRPVGSALASIDRLMGRT